MRVGELRDKIIQGDALESMRTLPDGCVDMCVTSPPYWGLRCYGVDGQFGLEPRLDCKKAGLMRLRADLTEDQRRRVALWLRGEEIRDG